MEQRSGSQPPARGLTVTQLTFVFIAGVAVCAIFFTLGFLVGTNERSGNSNAPTVERVSPPGDIPPPVNAPLNSAASSNSSAAAPAASSAQVQEENIPPAGSAGAAPSAAPAAASAPGPGAPAAAPIKSPVTSAPAANPAAAPGARSGLVVQVAALHSEKDATSMVSTLRAQDYPAFLVTPEQAGLNDGIYRVQIGPYPTRPAAENIKDKLAKEGFSPFIK